MDVDEHLCRREAALGSADEAVGLYRELAAARPDAFTPDLAISLNNMANRLSDLGRREEALAAPTLLLVASNKSRKIAVMLAACAWSTTCAKIFASACDSFARVRALRSSAFLRWQARGRREPTACSKLSVKD